MPRTALETNEQALLQSKVLETMARCKEIREVDSAGKVVATYLSSEGERIDILVWTFVHPVVFSPSRVAAFRLATSVVAFFPVAGRLACSEDGSPPCLPMNLSPPPFNLCRQACQESVCIG